MTSNRKGLGVLVGRQFTADLPRDNDLISAIKALCRRYGIQQANFNLMGTVSSVTLGTYDQAQQVFVTATEPQPQEVLCCRGNVLPKGEGLCVFAKICLADDQGRTVGGHLFSETIIYHAEIDLLEIKAPPIIRRYDPNTGLPARHFL
jgi:predicted DNA-binding protein with PD1-like motif